MRVSPEKVPVNTRPTPTYPSRVVLTASMEPYGVDAPAGMVPVGRSRSTSSTRSHERPSPDRHTAGWRSSPVPTARKPSSVAITSFIRSGRIGSAPVLSVITPASHVDPSADHQVP